MLFQSSLLPAKLDIWTNDDMNNAIAVTPKSIEAKFFFAESNIDVAAVLVAFVADILTSNQVFN